MHLILPHPIPDPQNYKEAKQQEMFSKSVL